MSSDEIHCTITVKGHLSADWLGWFGGLRINNLHSGQTSLSGTLPDDAALFGVLSRLYELGIKILSLNCSTEPAATRPTAHLPLAGSE